MRPKGYIRVSTLEQASSDRASLDMQKDSIINYAKSQGWEAPTEKDFYLDTSSGAEVNNRVALQRLREDIQNGKVKTLIVWRLDRLGRSLLDNLTLFEEFKNHEVIFKSVMEGFDPNTQLGRMVIAILSSFAEAERETITSRMITGRYTKTARDGTNFGSEAPFGYRLENKRYVIVEEEAEIVRKAFELYLTLKSIKRVQKELEYQKIECRIGFRYNQVKRMLNNIKYTGRMKVKDKVYEQKHLAIIADGVFNKVQETLKHNRELRIINWAYKAPGYFLRDIARCGHCKHQIVRAEVPSQKKTGGLLKYYVCALRRRWHKEGCIHRKGHKKEELEQKALSLIFEHIDTLLSDEKYLLRHLNITSQEEIVRIKLQIQSKENALKGRIKAKQRVLDALEQTDDPDILVRLDKIKQEIVTLQEEIISLKVALIKEQTKTDDFKVQKKFYKEFRENWQEADDQEKRDMINSLIRVAWVYMNGDIKIEYNF